MPVNTYAMNILKCSIAFTLGGDYGFHKIQIHYRQKRTTDMRLGFLSFLFLGIILIAGGGFVWLAVTDMPVSQQEISVDVPLAQ